MVTEKTRLRNGAFVSRLDSQPGRVGDENVPKNNVEQHVGVFLK